MTFYKVRSYYFDYSVEKQIYFTCYFILLIYLFNFMSDITLITVNVPYVKLISEKQSEINKNFNKKFKS